MGGTKPTAKTRTPSLKVTVHVQYSREEKSLNVKEGRERENRTGKGRKRDRQADKY